MEANVWGLKVQVFFNLIFYIGHVIMFFFFSSIFTYVIITSYGVINVVETHSKGLLEF